MTKLGNLREAHSLYRAILECQRNVLGRDHPDTINTKTLIARNLTEIGSLTQARDWYGGARADQVRVYGKDHPLVNKTDQALAEIERLLKLCGT